MWAGSHLNAWESFCISSVLEEMSCAQCCCRALSHWCTSDITNYITAAEEKKTESEEKHIVYFELALFFPVLIWLHNDCVSVSSTAWGWAYFVFLLNGASNEESKRYQCLQLSLSMISARSFVLSLISVDPFNHLSFRPSWRRRMCLQNASKMLEDVWHIHSCAASGCCSWPSTAHIP